MHRFIEYPDAEVQAERLAITVAEELADALVLKERVTLAVPGGTTPRRFLEHLSRCDLDWSRVRVMLTDERVAPPDSGRSNARLLGESLLRNAAAAAQFVSFLGDEDSPEATAAARTAAVQTALPLDICVLGMGADMHIASLFPDADTLDAALAPDCPEVLMAMRPRSAPEARLSLTAPVLTGAARLHLLIKGPDKLSALEQATAAPSAHEAPVKLLLGREALTIHFTEGASQ